MGDGRSKKNGPSLEEARAIEPNGLYGPSGELTGATAGSRTQGQMSGQSGIKMQSRQAGSVHMTGGAAPRKRNPR